MPTALLDLPTDITSQVFSYFERSVDLHQHGRIPTEWEGLAAIQACRLTCRGLNEVVSGLLCPFFRGRLDKNTMERIEKLSLNPLIAEGVRVVELNLSYRPKSIASDLKRYHDHVDAIVQRFCNSCDYDTEFQEYEDDDESDAAVEYRALLAAMNKFDLIQASWQKVVEPESTKHYQNQVPDVSYQQLLKDCFEKYAAQHQEEEAILSDGSFVEIVAGAISRFKHPAHLSFLDDQNRSPPSDTVAVAWDKSLLMKEMLQPHCWLDVETKMKGETALPPARLLAELPIACARLDAPIQGLDIGCFPLKTLFTSLIPPDSTAESTWSDLSAACRHLTTFQLGRRGLNCTPSRQARISPQDCAIVDGYLGAAMSSPSLTSVYTSMTPFRVSGTQVFRGPVPPDLYYLATPLLHQLKGTSLTNLEISSMQVSGSDLALLLRRLPRHRTRNIRLHSITLHEGNFADTMDVLRAIKADSKGCDIDFSSLSGGEFGEPQGFEDNHSWMYGGEDPKAFFDRLEEHMSPPLLRLAAAYVGGEGEGNPLRRGVEA